MKKLEQSYLSSISSDDFLENVILPSYNRDDIGVGIVHLGLGAFHRSHQAIFTEQLLNMQGGGDWGICGVSFRNEKLQTQLQQQDCLYTSATVDVEDSFQVVGALKEVLVVKTQLTEVLQRMAASTTKIVTLTVTEKGYCLNSDGLLDEALPNIISDLANSDKPCSAVGILVAALNLRFQSGVASFNVIACDNLPNNGEKLKSAVLQFAEKISLPLAKWININTQFPNTMVDCITPKTEQSTIDLIQKNLGIVDNAPVQREQFSQWVIEECDFERPAWEKVGVIFTENVEEFENAKLRILNGLHSALAYIGLLHGYETVYQAISDKRINTFLVDLVKNEIIPTLIPPRGLDLYFYSLAIIARFDNYKIKHLLSQIACDGSIKIPVRTLAPIQKNITDNRPFKSLSIVVAAWIHFIRHSFVNKQALQDPRATELFTIVSAFKENSEADVKHFLSTVGVLPDSIKDNQDFITNIQHAYIDIHNVFNLDAK